MLVMMWFHFYNLSFVLQAEEWISDRIQKMQEDSKMDLSNLQTKMKLLQKHQVFEAEILAHSKIIDSVQQVKPMTNPMIYLTASL